jgi:hypothetical protein
MYVSRGEDGVAFMSVGVGSGFVCFCGGSAMVVLHAGVEPATCARQNV